MVGEELLFHDVLHRFVLSDQVHLAGGVNHHHIGSQRDELHPLRHVVGAYSWTTTLSPLFSSGRLTLSRMQSIFMQSGP